jgi:hypothetical protein
MTSLELFIELTEDNRGKFKHKEKMYSMLENIFNNATYNMKLECTNSKSFGITFIEELSVDLNQQEQNDFLSWYYSQDIKRIQVAKDRLQQIRLGR